MERFFYLYVTEASMQQLFYNSCVLGDTEQLNQLLTPPVMDALQPPATNPNLSYSVLLYNYGIQIACKHHHTEVVRLLLQYKPMEDYVDFSMSNHYAIRTLCREGYDDIVRLILQHHPIHAITLFSDIRQFTQLAREHGHDEICRMLETPLYYDVFCRDVFMDDKVETGIHLLCYQDLLHPNQRRYLHAFMIAWLLHIIRLPRDLIGYICLV